MILRKKRVEERSQVKEYMRLRNRKIEIEIEQLANKKTSIFERYQPLIRIVLSILVGCPLVFFYYTTFVHPMLLMKSNEQEISLQKKEIDNLKISHDLEVERIANEDFKRDMDSKELLLRTNEKKYNEELARLISDKAILRRQTIDLEQHQTKLESEKQSLLERNGELKRSEETIQKKNSILIEINAKVKSVLNLVSPSLRINAYASDASDKISQICVLILNRALNGKMLSNDVLVKQKELIDSYFADIESGFYEAQFREKLLVDMHQIKKAVDIQWATFDPQSKNLVSDVNSVTDLCYKRIIENRKFIISYSNDMAAQINEKSAEIRKLFDEYSKL